MLTNPRKVIKCVCLLFPPRLNVEYFKILNMLKDQKTITQVNKHKIDNESLARQGQSTCYYYSSFSNHDSKV